MSMRKKILLKLMTLQKIESVEKHIDESNKYIRRSAIYLRIRWFDKEWLCITLQEEETYDTPGKLLGFAKGCDLLVDYTETH